MNRYLLPLVLFLFMFGLVHACAHAGGGVFYLPRPEGGCFEVESDDVLARAEVDFARRRADYRPIPITDQLMIFNACNEKKAVCYRLPVVCGDRRYEMWFWRPGQ